MPNILQGTVTKAGAMAKTITVTIRKRYEHPKYLKELERTTKMLVHDELQEAQVGDRVSITHTRPLSRSKNFYLSSIDQRQTPDGLRRIPLSAPPVLPRIRREIREEKKQRGTAGSGETLAEKTDSSEGGGKGVVGTVLSALGMESGASKEARR